MDFREVTETLQGAQLETHSALLAQNVVELSVRRDGDAGGSVRSVRFAAVISYRWTAGASGSPVTFSIVGLERLGENEPWRLYVRTEGASELELSCGNVSCDGDAVTGVGRSYRH